MSKASKEKEKIRKATEEQNRPWRERVLSKHKLPLFSLGLLGVAAGSVLLNLRDKKVETLVHDPLVAEHHIYGNLHEYKDSLPAAMVGDDLPPFKFNGKKFEIKYYIATEVVRGDISSLLPIPAEFHPVIKNGLNKWADFADFIQVYDPFAADLRIYGDGENLQNIQVAGMAIMPTSSYNANYTPQHREAINLINVGIIVNLQELQSVKNNTMSNYANQNLITHEFGHLMGLKHPDSVLAFNIKNGNGYKNESQATDKEIEEVGYYAEIDYPQFHNLTSMISKPASSGAELKVGKFDRAAIEIVIDRVKQAQSKSTTWQNNVSQPGERVR